MTEGLVTRIGKWIDRKWEAKATEREMENLQDELRGRWNSLENSQIKDKLDLIAKIEALHKMVKLLQDRIDQPKEETKELADLKTRMEKMELYAGMTRKVDPTKPPIAKSAFQM